MVKRYRASSLPNQRISPERRTLIIARYKELESLRAVANELKISRNGVRYWVRHFEKLQYVSTPPRQKRRTVVTNRYRRACVKVCRKLKKQNPEGTSISHVARVVTGSHGGSSRSVTRALDLQGYGKIRKERDVGLTPAHAKKRLIFARKLLKWSDAKLRRIVFLLCFLIVPLGSRQNYYVDKKGKKKIKAVPQTEEVFWGERYHGMDVLRP